MVTEFGKILRKERIEREWTLDDMAQRLEISPAYLSHMEMGRRPVPEKIVKDICKILKFHEVRAARLKKAANESYVPNVIKIDSTGMKEGDKEIALMFARRFSDLDRTDKKKLFELLQQGEDEEQDD
jgi:transcriptional regulator with XRE-family HTH domain